MKIGIISDTHNYLSKKTVKYLSECDEIWHAGDIGSIDILNKLHKISTTRAVFGNIDGDVLRRETKEYLIFNIESIKILMIHIAGRIESYNSKTKKLIIENKPDLLVCGHSHILKVARDRKFNLLHINPGAAGKVGFHKEKTIIRFDISNKKIQNMQVVKLDN
jgi:putative phosphoesterase